MSIALFLEMAVSSDPKRPAVICGPTRMSTGQLDELAGGGAVPAEGANPDPAGLREYLRQKLRGSRTPDRVVLRSELPTNAMGKVLRRELAEDLQSLTKEPA